ncbi:hypothetical protein TNCV_1905261 [Trichonephila clavipes]|nr:hypothetical protein TNCV_1905261 [Trichonephila clavipes]
MPDGTTTNADRYCEMLKNLRRAIQNKRRGTTIGVHLTGASVLRTANLVDVSSTIVLRVMKAYTKTGFGPECYTRNAENTETGHNCNGNKSSGLINPHLHYSRPPHMSWCGVHLQKHFMLIAWFKP